MQSSSQPSSPTSPRRSTVASPTSPAVQPHSRRSSLYSPAASRRTSRKFDTDGPSPYSPITTDHYRRSSVDSSTPYGSANKSTYRRLSTDTSSLHSPTPGGDGPLHESLADELANAWDEDEGIGDENWEPSTPQLSGSKRDSLQTFIKTDDDHPRDSGIDVASSPARSPIRLSSPELRRPQRPRHARTPSAYEHEKQQEKEKALENPDGLGAALERRIADISSLAAYDPESTANSASTPFGDRALDEKPHEAPIARLAESLQSLHMSTAQQSALETYTSRLISTSTSLATHLATQTRALHSLSFPIFSPLAAPPDPDEVDELLPLLSFAQDVLPVPGGEPLACMAGLAVETAAAVESLAALSDSLHLSRQTLATAARRLRTAKEAVADLRSEGEGYGNAVRWIEEGDWDRRLRERAAGKVCQDVVGGFERVCGEWRERLAQGQGVSVR